MLAKGCLCFHVFLLAKDGRYASPWEELGLCLGKCYVKELLFTEELSVNGVVARRIAGYHHRTNAFELSAAPLLSVTRAIDSPSPLA